MTGNVLNMHPRITKLRVLPLLGKTISAFVFAITLASPSFAYDQSLSNIALDEVDVSLFTPSRCQGHYYNEVLPQIKNDALAQGTQEICFSAFSIMYSAHTRTPLWSAYYLTPERIGQAANVKRRDSFAAYQSLPKIARAELTDYSKTGFDRGHLAPFAVMSNEKQGVESFYLTNIVPQHAAFNRGEWASIEARVRRYAQSNPVYVITGALFLNKQLERINKRVIAPSHMYKLVYDPNRKQAMAFVATNQPKTHVRLMNAKELEAFSNGAILLPDEMKINEHQLNLR